MTRRSSFCRTWLATSSAVSLLATLMSGDVRSLCAQQETMLRTTAEPSVLAVAADTSTSEFNVGGVRVILRRNTASDVIAANLFLLGGVQQLTPATQGIEAFLLAASERGTKN